jgi:peptidylprolyl isomerase
MSVLPPFRADGSVWHHRLTNMNVRHFVIPTLIASVTVLAGCRSPSNSSAASAIPAPPDVASPPRDATRTPTGLAFKVLQPGHGDRHPRPSSQVTVNYTGWTTDGKMFDSSVARGEPATFSLDQVISGWTEGVQMMTEGETCRFWVPESLAYQGQSGMPAGMLVFDIELIRIDD